MGIIRTVEVTNNILFNRPEVKFLEDGKVVEKKMISAQDVEKKSADWVNWRI